MITLDTSGLLSLLDRNDPDHAACVEVLRKDRGPYFISIAILSEIGWFLETRFPLYVAPAFLQDLRDGAYMLDWEPEDLRRIHQLATKYHDLRLGIADAAVIACAERHRGRVLTTDRRHFPVVARGEKTITVLPELLAP